MRLSLIVIYCPAPVLDGARRFYGAVLDAEPVREQHGDGPEHWSIASDGTGLVIEVYPSTSRSPTSTRLEFRGSDVEAVVQRLMDRALALPERTQDGTGFWCHDPCGNTVVLLLAAETP
ncbi:Glyoxalase-like domain [Mycobacteroides abscessus subsp. massiliense]|uniref:VOC family protein n=1 Tax=Mycobacteroides abscessus TaxID=36809 RepID=UPI000928F092|nr:VOC family protein [Mycobacteroides abscessus]SHR64062.1 Glyoxalase-like domain [Mycobacteroides abscessus subsp. abscessus]SKG48209.1 Glyoxalase-like domain [Mycobacteroides abscessus subsp. massiliense]SKG99658.1 Glyoxalase-like domain [Mycobacteroides abscessus subsp. massiliense]SKH98212.1 Glyoxalase-like domain [Mycobacteroides abscessus subsp. massiliense]SKJ28115.1 Glyoxalase-like domain [Mycobacteroides abscessus subsp. massiliense]